MRITHVVDDEAGTVELTLAFARDADPDQTADVAWNAVSRLLAADARRRGTVPTGLAAAAHGDT